MHARSARALVTIFGRQGESNPALDTQPSESGVRYAVFVEVDFTPVGRFQEAVAALGKETAYTPVGRVLVAQRRASMPFGIVFQMAHGAIEGVANDNGNVFMRLVEGWVSRHSHIAVRCRNLDPDGEMVALVMMAVGDIDGHVARRDAIAEPLEPGGALAHDRLYRTRVLHAVKRYLKWNGHTCSEAERMPTRVPPASKGFGRATLA